MLNLYYVVYLYFETIRNVQTNDDSRYYTLFLFVTKEHANDRSAAADRLTFFIDEHENYDLRLKCSKNLLIH